MKVLYTFCALGAFCLWHLLTLCECWSQRLQPDISDAVYWLFLKRENQHSCEIRVYFMKQNSLYACGIISVFKENIKVAR